MSKNFDIVILGGGFAGLAAASHCANKGFSVCLIEQEEHLGGLASGFQEPNWDWSLEHYYHHWFTSDTYVKKYGQMWNAQNGFVTLSPSTVMETSSGKFEKLDSPIALLKYKDISFTSRVRLAFCLVYLKLTTNWKKLEKITAEEWCLKYMGTEAYEAIWKPLLLGKFSRKYASEVNMAWLWARLKCRTQQLMTYEKGFMRYVYKGEQWLKSNGVAIYKKCSVSQLTLQSDKSWEIKTDQDTFHGSRVIACIPSPTLKKLTNGFCFENHSSKSLGAVVIILSLKKNIGEHYWYSLRKTTESPFLAAINHTQFVDSKHFNNENIVYVADYLDPHSKQFQLSDEEFTKVAMKTLNKINPDLSTSDVKKSWVIKSPYAQPIALINASEHLPHMSLPELPNLFHGSLAHVYPWDRGTNFALELGEKVAEKTLQSFHY